MKAFVEFGSETSYKKSSCHAEFKTWLKMVPYGVCFHFIGLFCYKALTVKADKVFKGSSYKMPKVKNYFLVNIYFIYRYSKIKKSGNSAIFSNYKRLTVMFPFIDLL